MLQGGDFTRGNVCNAHSHALVGSMCYNWLTHLRERAVRASTVRSSRMRTSRRSTLVPVSSPWPMLVSIHSFSLASAAHHPDPPRHIILFSRYAKTIH